MSTLRARAISAFFAAFGLATLAAPASAQTSGNNGSHDPSRMLESNGKVYIYSTGGGGKSSPDGLVWKDEGSPPWNKNLLPNNQGIWAPDGIYLNGKYLLYGSMWTASKSSALILLTTPSLDPTQAKWTDAGVAISGPVGVTHSVIDPAPVLDAQGNLWVVWGGGYPFATTANSIFVTRMDNDTGLPVTSESGWQPPNNPGHAIAQGHREGPYIYYHGGNYYLWWQTGSCCEGVSSGYVMHVSRSSAITGPYSGDRTFFGSDSALNIHGPGHIGIYSCGGEERFTYHYYPSNASVIGENKLTWGSDGWPVPGARVTTGLKLPCAMTGGGAGGAGGGSGMAEGGSAGLGGSGGASAGSGGDPSTAGGATAGSNAGGAGGVSDGSAGAGAPVVVAGGGGALGTPGGSSAAGGPSIAGGSAAPGDGSDGSSDNGASCTVSGGRSRGSSAWFALLALAALGTLRQRRRSAGSSSPGSRSLGH
ncbi:MAG: family 43 glycosylhydrolase [Myxococcales bacterium]